MPTGNPIVYLLNAILDSGNDTNGPHQSTISGSPAQLSLNYHIIQIGEDSIEGSITIRDASDSSIITSSTFSAPARYDINLNNPPVGILVEAGRDDGKFLIVVSGPDTYVDPPSALYVTQPEWFNVNRNSSLGTDFRGIYCWKNKIYCFGEDDTVEQFDGKTVDASGVFSVNNHEKIECLYAHDDTTLFCVGYDSTDPSYAGHAYVYTWEENDADTEVMDSNPITTNNVQCLSVVYYDGYPHFIPVITGGGPHPIRMRTGNGAYSTVTEQYGDGGSWWAGGVAHSGSMFWFNANYGHVYEYDGENSTYHNASRNLTVCASRSCEYDGHLYIFDHVYGIFKLGTDREYEKRFMIGSYLCYYVQQGPCTSLELDDWIYIGDYLGRCFKFKDDEIVMINYIPDVHILGVGRIDDGENIDLYWAGIDTSSNAKLYLQSL